MPHHLETYLNDHLAALTAAVELARGCHGSNPDEPLGPLLEHLESALEEERATIRILLSRLQLHESATKQGAAWLAEKLGRLKRNDSLLEYSSLSRVVELEGLLLAGQGRLLLWQAVAGLGSRSGVECEALLERAQEQQRQLEQLWRQALERALV